MREKVGLLFSGGVESSVILSLYLKRGHLVYPFYVKSGFPWERTEFRWAQRLWLRLKRRWPNLMTIKPVPFRAGYGVRKRITDTSDLEIPMRNSALILSALMRAHKMKIRRLIIGSLGMYPFPDNRREFFDDLERLISKGSGIQLILDTPLMGLEKEEVISLAGDDFPFHLTFSCASPVRDHHCGNCVKCRERREGFERAGVYFSGG